MGKSERPRVMGSAERFQLTVAEPASWVVGGIAAMRSAHVLWMEFHRRFRAFKTSYSPVPASAIVSMATDRSVAHYMYMAALALEMALKGLLVAKLDLHCEGNRLPKRIRHHKLPVLVKDAGFALEDGEPILLERLTEALTWKGRYHTPVDQSSIASRPPSEAFAIFFHGPKQVNALLRRIVLQLPADKWTSYAPHDPEQWLAILEAELSEIETARRRMDEGNQ